MRATGAVALVVLLALGAAPAAPPAGVTVPLEPAGWKAGPAAGVEMHLAAAEAAGGGRALRIDYDFHGRGGWAAARRRLDLELPGYYEIRFLLRGEGLRNNLELKLVDPSGDNVWWHVEREMEWPAEWTPVRVRKRQISFAWGPLGGGELRRIGALEITVSAADGGRGTVWIAGLEVVPVEPPVAAPGPLRAEASSTAPGSPAANAVDGEEQTRWRPDPAAAASELRVDLGGLRELGGVTLVWSHRPSRFSVELSSDGHEWTLAREVTRAGADRTHLRLPDAEARYLRVRIPADGGCADGCGIAEVIVRPLAFGASRNDFFAALAREAPRGAYPRGFTEAVYWTVVGVAGEPEEALFSEDGAVEARQRSFSLEPMVYLDGQLYTWADVEAEQTLADGDLPIPTVTWRIRAAPAGRAVTSPAPGPEPGERPRAPLARLEVTPLAASVGGQSEVLVYYNLVNESGRRLRGRFYLLARPFQVNPPYQFLNVAGGVAPMRRLECIGALSVEGEWRVWTRPLLACGLVAFDDGSLVDLLRDGKMPYGPELEDPDEAASGVLSSEVDLAAGGEEDLLVGLPSGDPADGGSPLDLRGTDELPSLERAERRRWRRALDRVSFDVPEEAAPLVRTLRSNLAFIEIHRDGAALQPGSRAYARSWIRDGALTGTALLRLRHEETAARFARWFAGYQYPDGKVPCCVDHRGADPVPENDSHGELVHLVAEVFRYTHDRAFAEELFPHVEKAVDALESLRQQRRTAAYRAPEKLAFFGLLPESISHEGYSAKPVHSYWDDTFAYRGLDDAVELARALGRIELASAWARRRDEFRADLLASIARVRELHHLDYVPASADLADFDSTSTTAMLDPGGLLPFLPRDAVLATFERFWREVVARREGTKEWEAYTPYEIRHVGAFLRLGVATGDPRWRDRAHELLAFYLRDRRPQGWNGWPEAVHRDYRAPRFLGDLPHGWVGSDFIRSLLDLFAYEREASGSEKQALVLGAGIPPSWLERPQGITVQDLGTPWGPLSYTLERLPESIGPPQLGERWVRYRYWVGGDLMVPPGGVVVVPPSREPHQQALVDGRLVQSAPDGTVVVRKLPALVDFLAVVPAEEPPRGAEQGRRGDGHGR